MYWYIAIVVPLKHSIILGKAYNLKFVSLEDFSVRFCTRLKIISRNERRCRDDNLVKIIVTRHIVSCAVVVNDHM